MGKKKLSGYAASLEDFEVYEHYHSLLEANGKWWQAAGTNVLAPRFRGAILKATHGPVPPGRYGENPYRWAVKLSKHGLWQVTLEVFLLGAFRTLDNASIGGYKLRSHAYRACAIYELERFSRVQHIPWNGDCYPFTLWHLGNRLSSSLPCGLCSAKAFEPCNR